jgi:hypothetical protein
MIGHSIVNIFWELLFSARWSCLKTFNHNNSKVNCFLRFQLVIVCTHTNVPFLWVALPEWQIQRLQLQLLRVHLPTAGFEFLTKWKKHTINTKTYSNQLTFLQLLTWWLTPYPMPKVKTLARWRFSYTILMTSSGRRKIDTSIK